MASSQLQILLKLTDTASGGLANAGKQVDTLGSKFSSLGKTAAIGLGILGVAASGAIAAIGLNFDSMRQQAQIAFTTMLGSGEKAKSFLDELQAFAAKTPFEFPDLVKGAQRLLAMGYTSGEILPTLTAVGDAVAGLGGGSEMIDRVTRAMGQMKAKGKVSAEEMMQLAEAGIPAWQILADAIGVSIPEAMKMSERGAISAKVATDALVDGMNKKFGGLMEQQSHTFGGLLSTIKDTFAILAGTVMMPFFERITKGLQAIVDMTTKPEFTAWVTKITGAIEGSFDTISKFFGLFEKKDLAIIFAATSAAIAAGFMAIAAAAIVAFIAENAALLGIPLAVAAAIAAITLLVTHWDAMWGALQRAPAALLDWLKNNLDNTLLLIAGPAGWLVLLVQNWDTVWGSLPEPVKAALDRVGDFVEMAGNFIIGVFEDAINKVIDGFNWLADKGGDFLHAISGGLIDVQAQIGKVDLGTVGQKFENVSGEHISTMTKKAADDFMSLKKTAEETRAGLREVFTEPYGGGGDGGGGDGGAPAALTAEQEALLALMKALDAAGMSVEQFIQWQIACQNAAAWLTDAAKALDMSLEDLVDVWLRSGLAADEFGRRIEELTALVDLRDQAEDAMGAVNGLYDAFNKLYEKPTVEGAAQNLALAQLREQRATLIAGGADSDSRKVKKIDEEIASIQADIDVRRAHQEVDRAWLDVKNATFLLDKDQETMTQALINQMGPLSTTAADFNTQLFIATWSLQELSKWFGNLASGGNDVAQRAMERYARSTEGERAALAGANAEQLAILWQGGKAPSFQMGGVMPYTGMAHLEKGERVIPAGRQLTAGESKRTLNFYAPITVQMPASASSLEEELARLLR